MPDTNHCTTNPSDVKRRIALEYAITELHGTASAACLVLLALRDDLPLPPGDATKDEAIGWMEKRLAAASENVYAIYNRRPPAWLTFNELAEIKDELDVLRAETEAKATEAAAE